MSVPLGDGGSTVNRPVSTPPPAATSSATKPSSGVVSPPSTSAKNPAGTNPATDATAGAKVGMKAVTAPGAVKHTPAGSTSSDATTPATPKQDASARSAAAKAPTAAVDPNAPDPPIPHGLPEDDKHAIVRGRSSASTIDSTVSPAQRATMLKDQQAALATAKSTGQYAQSDTQASQPAVVYGDYWKDHKYYVDPTTSTVYRASYDPVTGDVAATRYDDTSPDPSAPYPAQPVQTDNGLGDSKKTAAPGRRRPGDIGTKPGPPSDTTLVVHLGGSQDRTVTTNHGDDSSGGASTRKTREVNGVAAGSTVESDSWTTVGNSHSYISKTRIEGANGRLVQSTDKTTRSDPSGTYSNSLVQDYDASGASTVAVIGTVQTITASQYGHDATETRATAIGADGNAASAHVDRSLTTSAGTKTGATDITYDGLDAMGRPRVATATETGVSGKDLSASYASNIPATDPHFTYSFQHDAGDAADGSRPYYAEAGVTQVHNGMTVYVEGANLADGPRGGILGDEAIGTIDAAPTALTAKLKSYDALEGQNVGDAALAKQYGTPSFITAAADAAGAVTSFGTEVFSDDSVFNHELGHATGKSAGPNDTTAWSSAITTDQKTRGTLLATPGATFAWDDRERGDVADHQGVDDYAELALSGKAKTQAEDWAESVQMWIHSNRTGSIATETLPSGTKKQLTFADLFPERAKLLQSYYGTLTFAPGAPADGRDAAAKDGDLRGGGLGESIGG